MIDFPNSPNDGDFFSYNNFIYRYDSSKNCWRSSVTDLTFLVVDGGSSEDDHDGTLNGGYS